MGTYCFSPEFNSKDVDCFIGYYNKELHLTENSLVIKKKEEKFFDNADRNILN